MPGDLGADRAGVGGVGPFERRCDPQVQQPPRGGLTPSRGDLAELVVAEPVGVHVLLAEDAPPPELVEAVEEHVVGVACRRGQHVDAELAPDRRRHLDELLAGAESCASRASRTVCTRLLTGAPGRQPQTASTTKSGLPSVSA